MSFSQGPDIIVTPSYAGGIITLPASRLTLGGQQRVTTVLQVAVPSLTANSRYFVYARLNAGVPELQISQSVPSVYKASNLTAKLVAAFYANGMSPVAFGAFVNIEGIPSTIDIPYIPIWTSSGSAPSASSIVGLWRRNKDRMVGQIGLTVSSAGTGSYGLNNPTNLVIEYTTSRLPGGSDPEANPPLGKWWSTDAGVNNYQMGMVYFSTNTTYTFTVGASTTQVSNVWTNTNPINPIAVGDKFGCDFEVPIVGWDNTPFVDL